MCNKEKEKDENYEPERVLSAMAADVSRSTKIVCIMGAGVSTTAGYPIFRFALPTF